MVSKKFICVFAGFLLTALLCACSAKENPENFAPPSISAMPDENAKDVIVPSISPIPDEKLPDTTLFPTPSESEIDISLAAYRKEREKMTDVKLGGGASGYGAPNMEEYGLDEDSQDVLSLLDSREHNEAYEAAKKYVLETLQIKVETKATVYPCVDPKINAIYEAEDKGVAHGYESNNIFVCEYNDNGTWNYLILVRSAKGEPWEVIHHGLDYQKD